MKKETTTLCYTKISRLHFISWQGSKLLKSARDRRRLCGEVKLLHWPLISSLDRNEIFKALNFLFWRDVHNRSSPGDHLVPYGHSRLPADSTDRCKLELTDWDSDCISRGHLYVSFHNTHTFLFNHVTTSAYFYRCVLCWEYLINVWVKGQYCYITYDMDFRFVLGDPVCFDKLSCSD